MVEIALIFMKISKYLMNDLLMRIVGLLRVFGVGGCVELVVVMG